MGTPINIPVKKQPLELDNGSTSSEDLGVSPAHFQEYKPGYTIPGFYTLTFDVENGLPSYPGYYTAEIDFGTQELGDTSGWGDEPIMHITAVWPCPGYLIVDKSLPSSGPPQGQSNMVLKFSSGVSPGWPLKFSNISLTFTPSN